MPPGITAFHAHVYYRDTDERARAGKLREVLDLRFAVQLGRWRDEPVGPHPVAMYQVAFAPSIFAEIVPWLMLHRDGLVVLVHPETGRPRDDHLRHAMWLGEVLTLDGSILPETD